MREDRETEDEGERRERELTDMEKQRHRGTEFVHASARDRDTKRQTERRGREEKIKAVFEICEKLFGETWAWEAIPLRHIYPFPFAFWLLFETRLRGLERLDPSLRAACQLTGIKSPLPWGSNHAKMSVKFQRRI